MPIINQNNRQLHARNKRTVDVAKKTIERVTALAQEQYVNALAVQGFDCVLYNKLMHGRKCSCSLSEKIKPQILDENGNATQEHINSLLTGKRFGIKDYNMDDDDDPSSSFDSMDDVENFAGENLDSMGPDENLRSTYVSEDEDDDDFELEVDLSGEHAGRCGVCYGNSYVGGFSLFNGVRIVLDTTYFNQRESLLKVSPSISADMFNATILQTDTPFMFELHDVNSYVQFVVTIPRNIISLDALRVMQNFKWLNTAKLEIKDDANPSFVALTPANIMAFATGKPSVIKVSGVKTFTHLELQFNASQKETLIEYPRLTKTGDTSVLDAIDSVQLIVSPLVSSVQPWDIIVDNVYGKKWLVTSSNWFNDNSLNVHGWDVQARLVQEYEIHSNLTGRATQRRKTTNLNR